MNRLKYLIPVFLIGLSSVNGQILPKAFWELLGKNKMVYSIPDNYKPVPVKDNGDVVYDFAIKSKDKKIEIRYRIVPTSGNSVAADMMLITMALNISNGMPIEPAPYPSQSVKNEFGADYGSSGNVKCDSDFGKGYNYCALSVIHKDNVGDAFIFYLYDDINVVFEAMTTDQVFHALKFK